MQYEFVIACRNILLEDCGVQSYPVAQARTNNLVVGEEGLSTPLCEFFDVIQILHKQSNGERDRYHLSSEHMQNSKRKEEASHNNNHEKVVCNPRHKIKKDEPVVYNGFGSAFHAQIMRGVHARNYRNKACQRLVQLVLGSRAQNFLFPRTRSNLKKTAWQMPEPNIAATNRSLAAGVNVQNNYPVLSDELVVAFLCDQLKMHQFCVSFPSTGRIDLLRSCVGQDEVNYQGFREHLESHYRQTLASFRRRLGQIDNERMKQLRRFEADSELDRLALATEALKKQRQTIQIQDPELAQHLNKPSAKVGVGLHALDGSKLNTKDNDHGSAFSTNSKIFQIQKQKIGHNTQNSSADGVHLGWKMWAPVENYDPWIDAQGFSRPDQAVKKKRLRAKTKPIKFKHVVRCFMWSFDAAFENKISSKSERESEPPRKMPIVAKTRKGIVSDAAHMEFQNTTKKRITLQNSNLYKLDNIHKVELLQHKAALHQSLPSCDCLLSVDLDTKRSRSSYLSVSPDTGGTSTADAASKIDPRIAKHRLCYAITIELVEKCKELGASHDDEEAEHPYDRILWLQRRRARCEATRSVTLLHVSRAAIADMWNVLRQGLPSKIPCEVLPMFFKPQKFCRTFEILPQATSNPHFAIAPNHDSSSNYSPNDSHAQDTSNSEGDNDHGEHEQYKFNNAKFRHSQNKHHINREAAEQASALHNFIYRLQHEHGVPIVDESLYPMWVNRSLGSLLSASIVSNSLLVLSLIILLYNLINASILSMMLPIILFTLLLTDYPQAPTSVLRFLFRYMCLIIILKFLFQLPIFCENMVVLKNSGKITTGQWYPSIQPWCPVCSTTNCSDVQVQTYWLGADFKNPSPSFPAALSYAQSNASGYPLIQWLSLFGIRKTEGTATALFFDEDDGEANEWVVGIGFLGTIFWDIVLVVTLSFHRYNLLRRGLWSVCDTNTNTTVDPSESESVSSPSLSLGNTHDKQTPAHQKRASLRAINGSRRTKNNQNSTHKRLDAIAKFFERNSLVSRRQDGLYQNQVDERVGRDFYYATIWTQMVILLFAVFFYNGIVESNSASFTSQISNNQFSANLVVALIGILVVLIADRVIYLKQAALFKFVLHFLCVVMIHIWAFLWVPVVTKRPLGAMGTIFYLMVIIYLTLQARQLYWGYYRLPDRNAVMSQGYGALAKYIFYIYRFFPLLFEMRNVLDWICSSTSLYLFMWLRVENVYATLFQVKCNMRKFRYQHEGFRYGRNVFAGRQCLFNVLFGAACLAIAALAIILPLYLFSSLNPSQELNPVVSFDATLSIVVSSDNGATEEELGIYPLWKSNQYQQKLSYSDTMWSSLRSNLTDASGFCPLIPEYQNITQLIELVDYSQDSW